MVANWSGVVPGRVPMAATHDSGVSNVLLGGNKSAGFNL